MHALDDFLVASAVGSLKSKTVSLSNWWPQQQKCMALHLVSVSTQ